MLFLTSDLVNKAETTILSARYTTRAWVAGRGIMGNDLGVYKTRYNTWLSSRLPNQSRSFVLFICTLGLYCILLILYVGVDDPQPNWQPDWHKA